MMILHYFYFSCFTTQTLSSIQSALLSIITLLHMLVSIVTGFLLLLLLFFCFNFLDEILKRLLPLGFSKSDILKELNSADSTSELAVILREKYKDKKERDILTETMEEEDKPDPEEKKAFSIKYIQVLITSQSMLYVSPFSNLFPFSFPEHLCCFPLIVSPFLPLAVAIVTHDVNERVLDRRLR